MNTRDLICKEVDNEEKVYSDDERQAVMAGAAALDTTQFNRWLKRICTSVGVAYLSSQKIRFSAVTRMHDSGIPLSKIQKIAGHATPSTTEGYIRNKKSPTLSLEPWNELFN